MCRGQLQHQTLRHPINPHPTAQEARTDTFSFSVSPLWVLSTRNRLTNMAYGVLKILHLLGIVMLLGNVTITSCWKLFADRTGDPKIMAHAQRLVTITDWAFTFWGILLTLVGGYGAMWVAGMDPIETPWILQAEILFVLSGLIWLIVLVPIQIRQARQARQFAKDGIVPDGYRRSGVVWLIWGLVATAPLVGAMYVMVFKGA